MKNTLSYMYSQDYLLVFFMYNDNGREKSTLFKLSHTELSGGETSDYRGFDRLWDGTLTAPKVFLADKGYDSDHTHQTINDAGGIAIMPPRSNRKDPMPALAITYTLRNWVERCINKLKCWRRLAT